MSRFILVILAFIFFTQTGFAASEKISPDLKLALDAAGENSYISVIILLQKQADIGALDQQLHDQRASRAHRHQVIVETLRETAEENQKDFLRYLDLKKISGGISGYTPYWIINAVVLHAKKSVLEEIARRTDVKKIDSNFAITLIHPVEPSVARSRETLDLNHGVPAGIRAIRAPEVWYEYGITGAGRLVGNFDSGVDGNHPALASRWRGVTAPAAHCWRDDALGTAFPTDNHSHGTHVMGTICGNSEVSNDSIGVAPEASWIACRFTEVPSPEFDNTALAAFQWFVDPDGIPSTIEDVPDVVQNSWGVGSGMPGYTDCYPLYNNVIINCEAAGVVVVFSAGNEGPQSATLRSPATYEIDSVTVFCVGAVDATNYPTPPYPIANFSSRGPGGCPPYAATKPEVCAPGVDVYSSVPSGNYAFMNGTSMAGPHVAGIVALLRQAVPDAETREIKSILMRSAIDYDPIGEDNTFGFGFVDAFAAVQMLLANQGFVTGTVRSQTSSQPISGAVIQCLETLRRARTRSDGTYWMVVPGDSMIHLRFSGFGYLPQALPVIVSIGDTVIQNASLIAAPMGTLRIGVTAGASIPVRGAQTLLPQTILLPQQTDSLGFAEYQLPGDTSYVVQASYHDAVRDTTILVPNNQITSLTIRLESERSVIYGPDSNGYRTFERYDNQYAPNLNCLE
ncbi:hypothetical protein EHM69_13030, partial [candidate division KSB1 bacterium]